MPDPVSTPVPTEFESVLDEWIAGASVSKRSVVIYGQPGLYAEYQELERAYAEASAMEEKAQGELVGGRLQQIEQQMVDLYERWQASKSTWIVRAMSEDEVQELQEAEPALVQPQRPDAPVEPKPLPAKHTEVETRAFTVASQKYEVERAEFDAAVQVYVRAMADYQAELNLRVLAAAVERVELADGRSSGGVAVEQLRRLRKQIGDLQINRLAAAVIEAAQAEPEIPAPFSLSTSPTDPT